MLSKSPIIHRYLPKLVGERIESISYGGREGTLTISRLDPTESRPCCNIIVPLILFPNFQVSDTAPNVRLKGHPFECQTNNAMQQLSRPVLLFFEEVW